MSGYPVEDSPTARYLVTPEVSGTPAGLLLADSTTGTIQAVRYTVNAGSDSAAAQRLANASADCRTLLPDADPVHPITVGTGADDDPITDIYVLVVGDGGTDAGANNIVDSSTVKNVYGALATTVGAVAMNDITSTEILAATSMFKWTFSSVDDVRQATIAMGRTFDSDSQCYLTLEGSSYAA